MPRDQLAATGWTHFDHAADMGIRATGPTLADAFVQAAFGLTAIVTSREVRSLVSVTVRCDAPDPELLLVDWLNALIFEMATRRLLFGRFEVVIEPADDGLALRATAWGERVDRSRHEPAVEPKGATYTALDVHREADGSWVACCVVDV
ncbi:MAG: archease [Pseudomonadales bacterium]